MKHLLETISKSICEFPESISVTESTNDSTCVLTVHVDKRDLGKMIGKSGKTATSIRNIIFASSFKTKLRYTIDFVSI